MFAAVCFGDWMFGSWKLDRMTLRTNENYDKVIILGAAGFIGINLAQALAIQGYNVVGFDRNRCPHWPDQEKFIVGDFAQMPTELADELDNAYVFHLISYSRPLVSTAMAEKEVAHDVVNTLRYLEMTKCRNLRWIFLSSGGTIYGQVDDLMIAESCPIDPICSYGVVKATLEKYFALYRKLYNADYVVARLSNPYGAWQDPMRGQGLVAALLYKAQKGSEIEIWGNGTNVRDYIYIQDAISGICSAARFGRSGEIYNIGTGVGTSINELIELVNRAVGRKTSVRYSEARFIDVKRNVLDAKKLMTHTGWERSVSIEEGIALTLNWLLDNYPMLELS